MENENKQGIGYFEKYLTIWVVICMAAGVLVEVPVMLTLVKIANRTKGWFFNE
ncbi:hypothetical protein [Anaeromicropila populeti]|uniref:Arsenite transporter, ACR3 family n=1 Tax=Anaeromicropila populeti TaxID=37658 RepID=A0A1I6KAR1_9FIRM|nr:hypothetical protein [Anaeromicropila populeti]SFR88108.1 arsenite transporter, ACR3 family [Anaeromicropila populeti]